MYPPGHCHPDPPATSRHRLDQSLEPSLLEQRLAAGDDDDVNVHGVQFGEHVVDRHLVQLGLGVEAVPGPRLRFVTPHTGLVAAPESHEPAAAARRWTFALDRRSE